VLGLDVPRQLLLVALLDRADLAAERGIVGVVDQFRELVELRHPAVADARSDRVREQRVGGQQPSARRHPVGDVEEPLRPDLVEVVEQVRL